ncbi:glycosyltransferase 87 family protein [Streptomyces tsukubensis]|nr:glycosyltransferase 87 family protein [Streptomyces tsukubensis]QFR97722.1 DUF2029 domain-containing protein [Streptomyces tsukubensis]
MLWLLLRDESHPLGAGGVAREVYELYARWYDVLLHGGFPADDPRWQYPPGVGAVLLSPALLPGTTYFHGFVALTLAADAVILLALSRAGRAPGRSAAGAGLWTLGLPLLLHIPLARYDVQVTAVAVLALLALGRHRRVAGALAAFGALVKVWPVLVLIGTAPGRATRTAWTYAAATGTGLLALAFVLPGHPLAFLRQQSGRGVQIESLGGSVLGLARHVGWRGEVRYRFGAMEYTGPGVDAVAAVSLLLTAGVFTLLALVRWRWRRRAAHGAETTAYQAHAYDATGHDAVAHDMALSAVLLFTVTSRVISPQYLIWLLGLAAVCLTSRRTTQRPVAVLIALAAGASTVVYPLLYADVVAGTWTGCLVLLGRNGLLVAAAALSLHRLRRLPRERTLSTK